MTPAARVQAAISVLDRIAGGMAAEQALTNWARASRFAGSKDRAAVRDHVFDVLRTRRSAAALGGGGDGRALMLGALRAAGTDPDTLFTGEGHAPPPLTAQERAAGRDPDAREAWDLPDWLIERFRAGLGDAAPDCARALRHRAPVFLRVNLHKATVPQAVAQLQDEGIAATPHPLSPTALLVTEGARGITRSDSFARGWVDLQDAASQAVVDHLQLQPGWSVLDYCAGGGGKALAMAAHLDGQVWAHDADPRRMSDLPARAARAGAEVTVLPVPRGRFDLVLCDVPCSGSGAWRRAPEGKWRLDRDALARLLDVQQDILHRAAALVAPGGWLAYATCSVLGEENDGAIARFTAAHPDWQCTDRRQFLPSDGGDGFFVARLARIS